MPSVCSCTVIGADASPALTVTGALEKPSAGGDHVANVFQSSVNAAPSTAAEHQRFWPAGPQARSGDSPESRIAAASRSIT